MSPLLANALALAAVFGILLLIVLKNERNQSR